MTTIAHSLLTLFAVIALVVLIAAVTVEVMHELRVDKP